MQGIINRLGNDFPTLALLLLLAIVAAWLAWRHPKVLPSVLVIVAGLLSEPNAWGADYSSFAAPIMVAAAVLAVIADSKVTVLKRQFASYRSTIVWVSLALLWLVVGDLAFNLGVDAQGYLNLTIRTVIFLFALAVVLTDQERRIMVARLFALVILLVAGSYAVTLGIWLVAGFGTSQVGEIVVGSWTLPQPVYFPFTITGTSSLQVFGFSVPRLSGIGREPGWMAMYAAFVFFLLPKIGWKNWSLRALVALCLLGTVSTAGFGVFAGVLALYLYGLSKPATPAGKMLRVVSFLFFGSVALWAAAFTPVLGFAVKGDLNAVSLNERTAATTAGLQALLLDPFTGGQGAEAVGSVNLIASIATLGLPFALFTLFALLMPLRTHPRKLDLLILASIPMLTLLTSQPALYSTWVYAMVMIASAATMPASEWEPGGPKLATRPIQQRAQIPALD
ncbi:hypothetical protein [Cryobacterium arcticum]|uniref:Uncharacterized protein n=1 Tax=Cryobacterium arcticum TaxID=670052 RepID=A0A1B1BFT7_9MICO|nr:hypothetical protein [Cryobacterium arcticum]ANP71441.1 hypothetical protein PA27867_0470 [Cryobacterium arcticum]